jgi:sirohydrochlorin cobaltochelatase
MSELAIILFAHGARDPEWAAPFTAIQKRLQAARPDVLVLVAFQDFMAPTLAAAVAQSAAQGVQRAVVVPLFIGQGSHVKRDLPLLVDAERRRHPQMQLQVLSSIGDAPEILQAVSDWILQAAAGRQGS